MKISDIIPPDCTFQRIYCTNCQNHSDLAYIDFDELVSGIKISINGLPVLRCSSCGVENLPDLSRLAIVELHKEATAKFQTAVFVNRRKRSDKFNFTDVPFEYDPDDYYYIPGLHRPFDVGFLQPVFFKRSALLKYDNSPDYRVQFASTTYGQIVTDDNYISFGINRYGNLVMWLGDIAKLLKSEQYYLLSENIPSDHSIGSEFYDGQIEVKFTDISTENKLFKARSEFIENSFNRFGRQIAHLETETYDLALSFNPPIVDTPKERRHVTDTLNKIYIESFDNAALKDILTLLSCKATGTGSLKRLQAILEAIAPSKDIATILSPLYVLYDLRILYSHLTSSSNSSLLTSIRSRLGVPKDADLSVIYKQLIDKLTKAFEKMAEIATKS